MLGLLKDAPITISLYYGIVSRMYGLTCLRDITLELAFKEDLESAKKVKCQNRASLHQSVVLYNSGNCNENPGLSHLLNKRIA
jgi:hypothetical protein